MYSREIHGVGVLIPKPIWIDDDCFGVALEFNNKEYNLRATTAVASHLCHFWSSFGFHNSSKINKCSLIWLMLHELSHMHLGHFTFADEFGVAQRSHQEVRTRDEIRYDLRHLTPLCLEMQADHEATDLLLGAYSTDGWHELREKVLAILGMMMLIELEDAKNNFEGRTHPKAATRIFQLLGHLAEMPLLQAQVRHDVALIPSEEELQAFAHDVTIPCFFDAVYLAQATSAVSIVNDLGSSEDFFKDLEISKLSDPSRYDEIKTQGAQEWGKLWPCNEALKPILGSHFTN